MKLFVAASVLERGHRFHFMVNKPFTTLLNRTCDERQISSAELASCVERPYSTFRKWMAGTTRPNRTVIVDVCQRLGVDPRVALGEATAKRLQGTLLSLQLLQDRYARQRKEFAAALIYEIVNVAAAMSYSTVLRAGIVAILTIDRNTATIQPDDAMAAGLMIRVYGSRTCMMIDVQSIVDEIPILSEPLNDITLDNAIKMLVQ